MYPVPPAARHRLAPMAVNTVVAILIAVGEASSPSSAATTDAMTGAVAQALGPEASLVLRTTSTPTDREALALERELGADAVARVMWDGPEQTFGVLRAHVRSTDRWFERRVTFSSADSRAERGRTLGFAFAALLLNDPEAARPVAPVSEAAVEVQPRRPEPPASVVAQAASPATPPATPPRTRGFAIDLAALAATGVGGPARSLGAALHTELRLSTRFFARAGAAVRGGPVPGLDGEDTLAGLSAGLAFRPRVPERGRRALGLGLTLEALGQYQDLSHRNASGSSQHQGQLVAGVTGGVEGSWLATDAVELFLGLGAEAAFGTTDVTVADRVVATIPVVRLTAQAGVRWHD